MSRSLRIGGRLERTDFAVVAVLPETYGAVTQIFGLSSYDVREGYQWAWGTVAVTTGGAVRVVTGLPLDRGNIAAATFVDALIRAWRPLNVLVVDIGGGVHGRDDLQLGDVVTHTALHYYDLHKVGVDGAVSPRTLPLAGASSRLRELSRRSHNRSDASWIDRIGVRRPESGSPAVRSGEMLVGGAIQSDSPRLRQLLEDHPKVLAVEMEAVGAGRAVLDSSLRTEAPEYLVVRGISDYCNVDSASSQAMRDQWRDYAAAAAASHAYDIVREADASTTVPIEHRHSRLDSGVQERLPMVATVGRDLIEVGELGDVARQSKRLVLVGSAGAGKTVSIGAVRDSLPPEVDHITVQLTRWDRILSEQLMALPPGQSDLLEALDIVLEAAVEDVTAGQVENQVASRELVLIVDGLNEITADAASRVVYLLNGVVRRWPNTCVLATDRSLSRYDLSDKWTVAELMPLADDTIATVLGERYGAGTWESTPPAARRLLSLPFFLDLARHGTHPRRHLRSSVLNAFVAGQASISPSAVKEVISGTVKAYNARERLLARAMLSDEVVRELTDVGVIRSSDSPSGRLAFAHQLYGDYFASVHLAQDRDMWTVHGFDGVTFDAESFDPVTLAAEQLADPADGDRYLRAVYDWNWRAAVACLLATDGQAEPFSKASRTIVFALLNERRTDPVEGTRRRAEMLLAQFTEPTARQFAAVDAEEVPRLLQGQTYSSPRLNRWQRVYCRDAGAPWSDEDLAGLCDADPLHGWTVSYTLKRSPLAEDVRLRLKGIYWGASADWDDLPKGASSVRWRVVHTLGAAATTDALQLLVHALDADPHVWVRWAAARSIVELAARSDDPRLTTDALSALTDRASSLPDAIAEKIAWASQYRGAAPHFRSLMRPVLESYRESRIDELARAQWEGRMRRFDDFWSEKRGQ